MRPFPGYIVALPVEPISRPETARLAVRHLQEHKNRQDAERLALGDT